MKPNPTPTHLFRLQQIAKATELLKAAIRERNEKGKVYFGDKISKDFYEWEAVDLLMFQLGVSQQTAKSYLKALHASPEFVFNNEEICLTHK
jgi:hypothetical protein